MLGLGNKIRISVCLLVSQRFRYTLQSLGKLTNPPDTWAHFGPVTWESLGFEPEHLKMTPGDSNLMLA